MTAAVVGSRPNRPSLLFAWTLSDTLAGAIVAVGCVIGWHTLNNGVLLVAIPLIGLPAGLAQAIILPRFLPAFPRLGWLVTVSLSAPLAAVGTILITVVTQSVAQGTVGPANWFPVYGFVSAPSASDALKAQVITVLSIAVGTYAGGLLAGLMQLQVLIRYSSRKTGWLLVNGLAASVFSLSCLLVPWALAFPATNYGPEVMAVAIVVGSILYGILTGLAASHLING